MGSPDIADYPIENVRWEGEFRDGHRALLCATNAANVTITGGGIFGPPLPLGKLRNPRGPVLIELTGCTNAVLESFTTQYQQLWSIHLLFCQHLLASNLIIRSVNSNGDGIDVDSCDGVVIDHCDINTGDDAISLKSGRGLAAQNLARPAQNIVIRNSRLQSSLLRRAGRGHRNVWRHSQREASKLCHFGPAKRHLHQKPRRPRRLHDGHQRRQYRGAQIADLSLH